MSKMSKDKKSNEVMLEVTQADYEGELASGVEEEFALKPGKYKFKRGGHQKIDAKDLEPQNTKVMITMYVDLDILNEFKQRAGIANAAAYQTQMNNALRTFLEGKQNTENQSALLADDRFIQEVAKRVQKKLTGKAEVTKAREVRSASRINKSS